MNKYVFLVLAVVAGALFVAVPTGMKYAHASLLFGALAVVLAPISIHKVPAANVATGLLIGLAIFASFPLKKLFQIDGFVAQVALSLLYAGVLWTVGFGWKRSWKNQA